LRQERQWRCYNGNSFEPILVCRAQCRGGVGGLAAIVFGSHPPQYYVVAGTEFGANTVGRADKFAQVAVTPALGRVGAFRGSPSRRQYGLVFSASQLRRRSLTGHRSHRYINWVDREESPGVPPGGGRIARCLKAHKMEISVGCAMTLRRIKSRMGG
jgi:hypothetical protein